MDTQTGLNDDEGILWLSDAKIESYQTLGDNQLVERVFEVKKMTNRIGKSRLLQWSRKKLERPLIHGSLEIHSCEN